MGSNRVAEFLEEGRFLEFRCVNRPAEIADADGKIGLRFLFEAGFEGAEVAVLCARHLGLLE